MGSDVPGPARSHSYAGRYIYAQPLNDFVSVQCYTDSMTTTRVALTVGKLDENAAQAVVAAMLALLNCKKLSSVKIKIVSATD